MMAADALAGADGTEPWEVYVVKADSATLAQDTRSACRAPVMPGRPQVIRVASSS
jgi:hypothetical protein